MYASTQLDVNVVTILESNLVSDICTCIRPVPRTLCTSTKLPAATSARDLELWLDAQTELLTKERDAEVDENALLLSSCAPAQLEREGLAITNLGVSNVSIGFGDRTLVELERPLAHSNTPILPPHTFRPGDLARLFDPATLQKGKSKEASTTVDGVVARVSETKILIAVQTNDELDLPQRCHLYKLANYATFDRMEKTLKSMRQNFVPALEAADGHATLEPLHAVLLGCRNVSVKEGSEPITFMDLSLNASQKEAVKFCLQTQEVALVFGPPGTGKSSTLVEVIRQLVQQEKKILVCGASNLAVDNLVERLHFHQVHVTRIGHPARVLANLHGCTLDHQITHSDAAEIVKDIKKEIDATLNQLSSGKTRGKERKAKWDEIKELRKEYRKREATATSSVVSQARVVLSTCHGAGSRQIQSSQFDVVIIDEAAQALEAVCWIPILKGKKLILAGDDKQLPPTVKSDDPPKSNQKSAIKKRSEKGQEKKSRNGTAQDDSGAGAGERETSKASNASKKDHRSSLEPSKSLSYTLFDRVKKLYGEKITRMLTVQYRMHAKIMRFPCDTLYQGKLTAAEEVKDRLLVDLKDVKPDEDDCLVEPLVFYDTAGCDMFERMDVEDFRSSDSKFNENEAILVEKHLEILVKAGIQPDEVSIISPYQAQVALLTRTLKEKYQGVEIGSVDGFQGRENEVVIVSLVRSNDEKEVGFLKDYRRLNVAMTRPKRQLCVIGDSETVSNGSKYLKDWMTFLEETADVRPAAMLDL